METAEKVSIRQLWKALTIEQREGFAEAMGKDREQTIERRWLAEFDQQPKLIQELLVKHINYCLNTHYKVEDVC